MKCLKEEKTKICIRKDIHRYTYTYVNDYESGLYKNMEILCQEQLFCSILFYSTKKF